ncbi:MAG: prepilin-type N-terminal cleavage/methylation domain-containing protein, partial [Rubrivivax sp.]|nr:prepilin-type N-terminal cleavage/methylation domain-containing protein [Rubrivivax sp.]
MHTGRRKSARGVSLVEALVALAVMAIGMLGLVGMQSTLRANSDAAKQRSEAVRLAQEAIEEWRAFAVLTPTAGVTAYADIVAGTTTDPTIAGSNATYTRTRTVTTMPAPRAGKSLRVDVTWEDRAGEAQSVQLTTVIAGVAPELAASLSVPARGEATGGSPGGRHRAIPPGAIALGGQLAGRSGLIPPGATGVAWVFDNVSALITICTTTASSTALLLDTN